MEIVVVLGELLRLVVLKELMRALPLAVLEELLETVLLEALHLHKLVAVGVVVAQLDQMQSVLQLGLAALE
jgi:hypothetical protein